MQKPAKKKASRRRATATEHLWLAAFTFDRLKTEREGSFQILVRAPTPRAAMESCRQQLLDFPSLLGMFEEPIKVYSHGLLLLRGPFHEALVINFRKEGYGSTTDLMVERGREEVLFARSPPRSSPATSSSPS